jgi:signal transduction histidine kinase
MAMTVPGKRLLAIAIALNALLLLPTGAYILGSFFGMVPMTRLIFLVMLAVLAAPNLIFVALALRLRERISLFARIMTMLWGWFVFWFWVFSPPYFLLVMNTDALQIKVISFAFTWEVLSFGAAYLGICYFLLAPLARHAASGREAAKDEAAALYRRAARFPATAAILICAISATGFIVGDVQVRILAALPYIEAVKNFLIGFVAAVFLAIIYYHTLRYMLDPLASALEERGQVEKRVRASISSRLVMTSVMVVLGALLLLQLIAVKSFQNIVRDGVAATLAEDIARGAWNPSILEHGEVLVDPSAEALESRGISPESAAEVLGASSGIADDQQGDLKLIGSFTDPLTGSRSVVVVPLEEYYGPLTKTVYSFLLGALFTLLAGVGIAALSARSLARSIQELTRSIRRLERDPQAAIPALATGDEIEELSEALGYFVRRSQKLDREKDEFISIASHHLRTPVTELEWLVGALAKGDPKKNVGAFLPDIQGSIAHLAELVKLLLDTHRFDDASQRAALAPVELAAFAEGEVAKYRALAGRSGIALTLEAPARLEMESDPIFLGIIFESLLANAVGYTPEGGSVALAVEDAGDAARIVCRDTGIGIAPADQEHLFTKFTRAENARKVKPNGTGLGLYVAKQAAGRLGGEIALVSELGRGSTFTVTLPKHPRES